MKRFVLLGILIASLITLLPIQASACFDTYLFLLKGGLTYPHRTLAFDANSEYRVPDAANVQNGSHASAFNAYYGLARDLTLQAAISSSTTRHSAMKLDELRYRAVFGLVRAEGDGYNLDAVLQHNADLTANGNGTFEFSLPSIWHVKNYTLVAHPVGMFGRSIKAGVRGHGGVFYSIADCGMIGVGAEYASAQSSSKMGERLVKGVGGTSLFLGTMVGQNLFLQSELIKGWGSGSSSSDYGISLTAKVLFPSRF